MEDSDLYEPLEYSGYRFANLPLRRGNHDFNLFLPPYYVFGPDIASGEFATVKLAYNMKTGRNVAIKCFYPRNGHYTMLDEQMIREMSAMKGMIHDHIVSVYESIIYGNRVFIVMEHCSNGDLRRFINRGGALDEENARVFFSHLILGVKKMHSMDLIHRDLKLENLLIDSNHRLKIADFGCARRQIGKRLNTVTGSYAYGAPELFRGDHYDGRKSDVWSMGIILYAMLVGKLPYRDKGSLRRLLRERMEPLQLPPRLSQDCCDLVNMMLAYNPVRRASLDSVMSHPWMEWTAEDLDEHTNQPSL